MANKYTARSTVATVVANSEMAALANGSSVVSATVVTNDSAATRFPYGQIEVNIGAQGANRTIGSYVAVYLVPELDGTNFATTTSEGLDNYFVGSLSLNITSLAAFTGIMNRVRLPPGNFKVAIKNSSTQAFGATGNSVELRTYSEEDVV